MDATDLDDSVPRANVVQNVALACAAMVALLSASCCIVPIGLTIVGLGGAWLSFLDPFAAHRELILIFVSLVVGCLWLRILRPEKAPPGRRLGVTMATAASLATVLAWTAPLWAWQISGALLDIWANRQ